MKYAYCPFDDVTTVDAIRMNIEDFHKASRFDRMFREHFDDNIRMWTAAKPRVLGDVWRISQVYIFGHGMPKADDIEAMDGTVVLIPELANRIAASGLSTSHRTIKLFSCNGGTGGSDSMAGKLWKELKDNHGFNQLTVYGYTDEMVIGVNAAGHKIGASGAGARAQDIRVKFG
jgi:hypothetical protein